MSPHLRALVLGCFLSLVSDTNGARQPVVLRQALSHAGADIGVGTISADGKSVAVVSLARLLPADVNTVHDIYVFDRETRVITLETEALDARTSNGSSGHADLSSDGRYLVFDSIADNLTISADRNGLPDVFVRDRRSKTTRRLSLGPSGQEANGTSEAPVISEDGRFVAFTSSATNLVADVDANGAATDVYLARIETGEITRASVDSTGAQFAVSFAPSLGSDGHLVAYTARGRDEGSAPGRHRASRRALGVYVRDTTSGQTTCVSCGSEGAGSRVPSFAPDLSSDGRLVTFVVQSGPHPLRTDVAVHDRSTAVTTVVTRHVNARSDAPRISGDGRFVVFESWASDLLCSRRCSVEEADANVLPDVYLFDRDTADFRRLSGAGHAWWAPSRSPNIDARGHAIVFSSRQPFGPEDTTVDFDLYVCDPACQ